MRYLYIIVLLIFSAEVPAQAQKKPKTAEEFYNRGNQNLETKPNLALVDFEAALKLDSSYCAAYSTIAYIKGQKSDYKSALSYHTKAISCMQSKNDKQGVIMFTWNRGMCKHEMKDFVGALQDYDNIIALDSNYTTGYTLSAFEFLFLKKYDEATARAKKILLLPSASEDDKMTVERYNAHSLMLKGEIEKALEIHKKNENYQFQFATWKIYIQQEFADFRKHNLPTQHFATIEKALGLPISK